MKSLKISILFLLSHASLHGQDLKYYRYDKDLLPAGFHRSKRAAFREAMPENSVAVFFSNPVRNRSNDNDYDYHQDPNFYYLTGFTEPDAVLLVFKSTARLMGKQVSEVIFVPDRDPAAESWTGRRAGKEGAAELLGIENVMLTSDFDKTDIDFKSFSKVLYILPRGVVDDKMEAYDLYDLLETFRKKAGNPPDNGDARQAASILSVLREIKSPEEITLLRKSIDISCRAHLEMMHGTRPGMSEYEVQAVGEYVFKRSGAEYEGYSSICGGGENSTILHYSTNRRPLAGGDLLLLDMGAEYHGYSADVTRTLPVGGRFSESQRKIYELVYKAQEAGMQACKAGNGFSAPHQAAMEVIRKGLLDLGIIQKPEDARKYFFHGTSHYLGLDVHDAGTHGPLLAGTVITVEPGIYIPEGSPCDPVWWNIGIRIEDDILITQDGYENLSKKAPRTADDVEKAMKQSPEFIK